MQHTLIIPPPPPSDSEFAPNSFSALILYENFETGKQAKKTYDVLVENLGRDCRCSSQMWKFDVLSLPKLSDIALRDACMADILMISCRGDELPATVQNWLNGWAGAPGNALALVALFDCPPEQTHRAHSVRTYLARLAGQAQVEFFAQPDAAARIPRPDLPLFQNTSEWRSRTLSSLAGAVRNEVHYPHWGINE
jgi:hypothetical protein